MSVSELQPSGGWATAWKTRLLAPVPFWTALFQTLLISTLAGGVAYLLALWPGSPWFELSSLANFVVLVVLMTRLSPGRGLFFVRVLRVVAWGGLLSLLASLLGWWLNTILPLPGRFLGVRLNIPSSFAETLINTTISVFSILLPVRVLQLLRALGRVRLRWQLTFSYLLIGLLATIVFPLLLSLFIGSLSVRLVPGQIEPQVAVVRAAVALAPLVRSGASAEQLSATMHGLLTGEVQLPMPPGQFAEGLFPFKLDRIRLVRPDGVVLADLSGSEGEPVSRLSPEQTAQLGVLLKQFPQGGCIASYVDRSSLQSSSACIFLDQHNTPVAAMLLQAEPHGAASTASPPSFSGVERMLLLRPDGVVLAGTGKDVPPSGAPLPSQEATRLSLILAQVQSGGCTNGRPADGPLAETAACAIQDEQGKPIAILLLDGEVSGKMQIGVEFTRIVSLVLGGTNVALGLMLGAMIVILLLALGVGYVLARRLTRGIERLAFATADIAAGTRGRRVEVDTDDEIGRLSADFNTMAERLSERERALENAAAQAEALLRANRQLVADVSHELRTPLATLRGYIEALEQEYGDRLPPHDLDVIQREIGRLTRLIDELFTLVRAEAQQLPLEMDLVDARALAYRMVETFAPLARRERQIEIVAALPDRLPPVMADRGRLEQVLINLVQNALRYTPNGGIVAFEGSSGDGMVTLVVADTGVGISSEELPHIFERFYRGDSSRTRETGGAGLGLALVKELIEAMGGTVSVESVPGRGSRFCVSLRAGTPDQRSRAEGDLPRGKNGQLIAKDQELRTNANR